MAEPIIQEIKVIPQGMLTVIKDLEKISKSLEHLNLTASKSNLANAFPTKQIEAYIAKLEQARVAQQQAFVSQNRAMADSIKQLTSNHEKLVQSKIAGQQADRKAKEEKERAREVMREKLRLSNQMHNVWRGMAAASGNIWLSWGNFLPMLSGLAPTLAAFKSMTVNRSFSWEMMQVGAAAEIGNVQVKTLSERLLSIGEGKYTQGPVQMAQALRVLAQAGMEVNEAMAALPSVLNLAMVAGTSDADAATFTAGLRYPFGLFDQQSLQAGIDRTAKAAAVSQTSIEQMMQSMKQAAPAAAKFGLSVTDVSAALAALAQVNITGSSAGTAVKNLLTDLGGRTKRSREALQALGISAYDASGMIKPFVAIIEELQEKFKGMTDQDKQSWMKSFLNERGMRAADVLLNLTTEQFRGLHAEIARGAENMGYTTVQAERLGATAEGAFRKMKASWETTFATVGARTDDPFKSLMGSMTAVANSQGVVAGLTAISSSLLKVAGAAVSVAGALAPLTPLALGLGTAFGVAGLAKMLLWVKGSAAVVGAAAAIGKAFAGVQLAAITTAAVAGPAAGALAGLRMAAVSAATALGPVGWAALAAGGLVTYLTLAKTKTESFADSLRKLPQDLGAVKTELYQAFNTTGRGMELDRLLGLSGNMRLDQKLGLKEATDAFILSTRQTIEAFEGNLHKINATTSQMLADIRREAGAQVDESTRHGVNKAQEYVAASVEQEVMLRDRKQTLLREQLTNLDKHLASVAELSEADKNLRIRYEQEIHDNAVRLMTLRTQMAAQQLEDLRIQALNEQGFWDTLTYNLKRTGDALNLSSKTSRYDADLEAQYDFGWKPKSTQEEAYYRLRAHGQNHPAAYARIFGELSLGDVKKRYEAEITQGAREARLKEIQADPVKAAAAAQNTINQLDKLGLRYKQVGEELPAVVTSYRRMAETWLNHAHQNQRDLTMKSTRRAQVNVDPELSDSLPELPGSDKDRFKDRFKDRSSYVSPYADQRYKWEAEQAKERYERTKARADADKRVLGYVLPENLKAVGSAHAKQADAQIAREVAELTKQSNELLRKKSEGNLDADSLHRLNEDLEFTYKRILSLSPKGQVQVGSAVHKMGATGAGGGFHLRTDSQGLRLKADAEAAGKSKPATYAMAHLAQQMFGKDLVRFGALRDASHRGKSSRHNSGEAFDFTPRENMSQGQKKAMATQLAQTLASMGLVRGKDFAVGYEWKGKVNTNKTVSNADHVHAQLMGEGHNKLLAAMANGGIGGASFAEQPVFRTNEQDGEEYTRRREEARKLAEQELSYMNEAAQALRVTIPDEEHKLTLRRNALETLYESGRLSADEYAQVQMRLEQEKLELEQRTQILQLKSQGVLTAEQETELEKLHNEELARRIELLSQAEAKRQASNTWQYGVGQAFRQITDEATNYAALAGKQVHAVAGFVTDAFENMALGGKKSFREMTVQILKDLAKIYIRMAVVKLISGIVGGMGGGGGGGNLDALFARGGAIQDGRLLAYASGGIVNSPTYFGMQNGRGLMGEQGAEAIMPLTRMANGDLGVAVNGGGQGGVAVSAPVTVSVVVHQDGSSETNVSDGQARELGEAVRTTVLDEVSRMLRPGGMINSAIKGTA